MIHDRVPDIVPVFPLPNLAFFPGTVLPLRVFEPRYVELVEEIHLYDRWMAVTQLRSGFERDTAESPAFYPVAGAGRITSLRPQTDGTYLIEVQGHVVVRLDEVASDRAYRRGRTRVLVEDPAWLDDPEAESALDELLRQAVELRLLDRGDLPRGLPDSPLGRSILVNQVAMRVLAEPEERQALLEARDYRERAEMTLRQLRVMSNLLLSLGRLLPPEDPARN